MTVLVLTTVLPQGQRSGGEIVSQAVVDAIAATGREVRVVGYRRPGDDSPPGPGEVCAGRRPIETAAAGPRAAAWLARALVTGAPYSVAKYHSRGYVRAARHVLAGGAEAVLADHAQVAFAVRRAVPADVPLVFVAHNVEESVYAGNAANARGRAARWAHSREARAIGAREAYLAGRARQVWTLSAADRDHFRRLLPAADVRALEVPARDLPAVAAVPSYDVALIGSWSWDANRAGLEWFEREVVPLVPRDLTVRVAGAGGDWLRGRHPNVEVCGRVEDAGEFLAGARVVAVPAVAGSGVQVKTLDAIRTGIPVVSTPTGVRGLGELPASVALGGDAGEFAAELERLARAGARDAVRAEALRWSAARRERFTATLAAWLAEAAAVDGGTPRRS